MTAQIYGYVRDCTGFSQPRGKKMSVNVSGTRAGTIPTIPYIPDGATTPVLNRDFGRGDE